MEKETEEIILDTDDKAAQLKTVTGWVSREGQFFGQDESLARFAGCTHRKCNSCENITNKSWLICESCRHKKNAEEYKNMSFKEWDKNEPICTLDGDKYFFEEDELQIYCEENEIDPEDLMLVICEGNYPSTIHEDYWQDDLPEDGEIPEELQKKVDEINALIKTLPPLSYYPSKVRTSYKLPKE